MKGRGQDAEAGQPTRARADEPALELMKQLITLAAGVLALSATFIERFPGTSASQVAILIVAWVALLASIFFGLETLSAIVKSRLTSDDDWSTGYGKASAQVSKYAFTLGVALVALFSVLSFSASRNNRPETPTVSQTIVHDQ
jgi:hypothetical protein